VFGPRVRLVTAYGVTEATVDSTFGLVEPGEGPAPVGGALPGVRLHVVDAALGAVPVGVDGELGIAGVGVARGYLGRPVLTAERFVADPFAGDGSRLYRTGDVVRRGEDGRLWFQGRSDLQLNVRGFRVEPGEVEHVLVAHPAVSAAVVVADGDRLVAFVVGASDGLREWVSGRLPQYMVPAVFVELTELPLSANGKVDRAALSVVGVTRPALGFVAPQGATQEALAGVWAELIGVDRVGATDNFFALGGHSLLATQVISRVRALFGVEVPVAAVFDNPTVAGLAAAVEVAAGTIAPPVVAVERGGPLPLSFAQQRLWFLHQLEPDSLEYNLMVPIAIDGELDLEALGTALTALVARHEVLRTRLVTDADGVPWQVIDPAPERFDLPVVDELGPDEPFDLAAGPLFRATLLRVATDEHVLVLVMHHVIGDEWSAGILRRELDALYAGADLADLPVQYADFAVWQRQWLTGETLEAQLDYWRERLAGLPTLELPADRPRPAVRSVEGAAIRFTVPERVADGLRAVARAGGASMFMTALSAFTALLSRYTGQDDIVVGTPIANRSRAEVEGLIGFFLNTLVVRADLSGDPTFTELLSRVRAGTLAAYAHQDLPFERLVDELEVARDRSRTPLFQTLFTYETADGPVGAADDDGSIADHVAAAPATFDLSVSLGEAADGLAGVIRYSTALFDADRMRRLIGHFQQVLAAVAAEADDLRVSQLPLLTPEWDAGAAAPAWAGSVDELVAARSARQPGAVALVSGEDTVSYAGLQDRVGRLAGRLRAAGVGAESVVGICVERGIDMVVAALAVWRAGGAYLPLDPQHPADRRAYMLADSGAAALISDGPADTDVLVVAPGDATAPPVPEPAAVRPGQTAYVIYTSGSTGRPKGVVVSHGNLAAFLAAMGERPGMSAADVLLAVTTFGFDIAGLELFLPLVHGARVVIAGNDVTRSPRALAALADTSGATVLQATPATWQMLVEDGWAGSPRMRALSGGEALPPALAEALAGRVGALWNMYGPTETTVWSACEPVPAGAPITLGEPIAGTTWHVLDRFLQPVPAGVPGELYIGGAGVARGYRGRPELTAERFIADPFGEPGGRLYRTGDQVRRRTDGRPEFLGRVDHQVKIRGHRIEPAEIEAVLRSAAGVSAAVVVALDGRLVAYVVGETGGLREWLGQRLPEYMVPSALVELSALPLNSNGKVDRAALPAPDIARMELAGAYVAPEGTTQELLAGIWAGILGVGRVGAADNFFALGGHSLLATQVVSRVRSVFGVEVPVAALFDGPTIEGLAVVVDAAGRATAPPIVAVERDAPLPLSFAQQRLWFLHQLDPDSAEYNTPMFIRLTGELDVEALTGTLTALVARHEVLRTRLVAGADGVPYQVIDPAPERFDLQVADELGPEAPFDLAAGPLFRAMLVRAAADDHVLALVMHHVISDEWSAGILRRELDALYAGEELPALPVQYADFAVWQRQWLSGDVLEGQLGFWRDKLAGAPTLDLPTDRPRPAVRSSAGAAIGFTIPPEATDGLRALARDASASMFMTLFSAFAALLARYSGQEDVVVGTPVANRNRAEIEGLIGFFINTLVLRTDLSGDPTFAELLSRVRSETLAAHAHQDLPFERLVDELGVERDRSRSPLFQVLFNYFTAADAEPTEPVGRAAIDLLGGVDLRFVVLDHGDSLTGTVEYSTALFDDDRISRLAGHFVRL
ncbi:non-ribosomal peptide synthetase, partial [Dactylosporangium siamense]